MNGFFNIPYPKNEPIFSYKPGSKEREELKKKINELKSTQIEIPLIIGGEEIRTGITGTCIIPHNKSHILGIYHKATEKELKLAIQKAKEAWNYWAKLDWEERVSVFLKAAELLANEYRYLLNASAMLDLSKTCFQAEIDSACELIDFFRFNSYFAQEIYKNQPESVYGIWNRVEYRALEGFIFAITPFNFASIAGNLPSSPAIMGNVVLWKPASSAVYNAYHIMQLLMKAGLPDGVINFVPCEGKVASSVIFSDPDFSGVHFTGSTETFNSIWQIIGNNLKIYKNYPRIVGETGGKDFVFVHNSAPILETAVALVRGAYEYQGQKCSAASRAYIPRSIWPDIKQILIDMISSIKIGETEDFRNFMSAVIDEVSFNKCKYYIEEVKKSSSEKILIGGNYDDSKGYFVYPTLVETTDPYSKTMQEEIFGPILTCFIYDDDKYEETLEICNNTSIYGLTGSIFANDRKAIQLANKVLRYAAGNFYINDKPTGAVVNQQPFGGGRKSGTNDKAGSYLNLLRWVSARSIKENFIPPKNYTYPFMDDK